ncbi:MAG: AcvB/VirJ family lysyl-phosphatidylglycerol hydrolase [Desulfobacterales bacterium]
MKTMVVCLLTVFFLLNGATVARAGEAGIRFGRFGELALYHRSERPARVVLFVSGDGGWDKGGVELARELATLDALVVGVDINYYLKQLESSSESCVYPAADFEMLSQYIQKKFDYPQYTAPVLIGYSSGATLVYATLAQAPGNTFAGAIGLGFCPDLALSKPLCRGSGLEWTRAPAGNGTNFLPATHLTVPFIAIQGTTDPVCDAGKTKAFVDQVKNGKIIMLPEVGHGFAVPKNWMPQLKNEFNRLVAQNPEQRELSSGADLADLPLKIITARGPESDSMAVFWSGDGGWADLDKDISGRLAARGVAVVGVNSLAYFWTRRTPDQIARDLERIIGHYAALWQKEKVALIGYSFGADILPFAAARLSDAARSRVALLALLGPGLETDFEFQLGDWLGSRSKSALPTKPEVLKLSDMRLLCIFGEKEKESLCPGLQGSHVKKVALPGAHHFDGNYDRIAEAILAEIK